MSSTEAGPAPAGAADARVEDPWSGRTFLVVSIVGAWTMYLALVAVRVSVIAFPHAHTLIARHGLTAATGVALTVGLHFVLKRFANAPISTRISAALVASAVPAMLLSLVNYDVMFVFAPEGLWSVQLRQDNTFAQVVTATMAENYFLFIAWATLYTAVSRADQFRAAQRAALAAEAQARAAQLQALRYQLNPHFMFNALNSVSALILQGDAERADATVAQLSAFLRTTLDLDVSADITLDEEIRLQHLYLAVEQIRFGDRLSVVVKAPVDLHDALVPSLILQPLIENVVRHAVSASLATVKLCIVARAEAGTLHLRVEDDARTAAPPAPTGGRGLRNVRERLAVRFENRAGCTYGPRPQGGFRVDVRLPLRRRSRP